MSLHHCLEAYQGDHGLLTLLYTKQGTALYLASGLEHGLQRSQINSL